MQGPLTVGERLKGNTIRGNRPERFWEGNLPLRGSLRGVFRGFQRFWEVFKGPLRDPLRVPFSSQSCRSCCPLMVLPLKTPTIQRGPQTGWHKTFDKESGKGVRAARLLNKIAPEKCLNRYKRPFVHKNVCSHFLCPLTPPPPKPAKWWISLEFLLKWPQTELRTLSKNCEQTLQNLRTNRIVNKRAFLN